MLYPMTFSLEGMGQPYLWGGQRLRPLMPEWPADQPLAEVWALADRSSDSKVSVVANGPLAGQTLSHLTATYPRELLGYVPPNGRFPVLVKLLDAAKDLSLQVHPPEEVAARLGAEPKTEAWIGLRGCDPDASVFAGFSRQVTVAELVQAITTDQLLPLLHRLPLRPGNALAVPAGRVHGINAGFLGLEVQQSSNTSYRLYDYGRIDPRTGQPRPLHVEQGLASLRLDDVRPRLAVPQSLSVIKGYRERVIDTSSFEIDRVYIRRDLESYLGTNSRSTIVVNLDRAVLRLLSDDTELSLREFGVCLIPASVRAFEISGSASYLLISIPHPRP